jgi:carboxyl-terminal processing protease
MKYFKYIIIITISIIIYSCSDLIITSPDSNKNVEDIEEVWQRINSVYPYLKFKNINWDSLHTVYISKAEKAKGDEIYLVLRDMLYELKDGHVYYRTDGGGKVYPFYPARFYKDRYAYSPFVVRKYFDKELKLTESSSVEYEILPGNIGYAFLSDFHEDYLIKEFPGILEYLKNTKGLIIDIRQKRGGGSDNVEAVVTRFMTSALDWPKLYFLGKLYPLSPLQPRGPFTYMNPVVVLINGSTFSAGELCTEILKQLPNVTVVGDTTGGGGGAGSNHTTKAISDYELPSGKLISTPTGYFECYDGQMIEWLGVPPDIRVEQTEADILAGRDKQLEYAIEMLK